MRRLKVLDGDKDENEEGGIDELEKNSDIGKSDDVEKNQEDNENKTGAAYEGR